MIDRIFKTILTGLFGLVLSAMSCNVYAAGCGSQGSLSPQDFPVTIVNNAPYDISISVPRASWICNAFSGAGSDFPDAFNGTLKPNESKTLMFRLRQENPGMLGMMTFLIKGYMSMHAQTIRFGLHTTPVKDGRRQSFVFTGPPSSIVASRYPSERRARSESGITYKIISAGDRRLQTIFSLESDGNVIRFCDRYTSPACPYKEK